MTGQDEDIWFEPKRFGYGTGLPVTWQGWVLTLGFVAVAILGGVVLAPQHPALFIAALIPLTLGFMVLTARHTRGGWRWRWGRDD